MEIQLPEIPDCTAKTPSVYVIGFTLDDEPIYSCRCIVCRRCNRHTGNANQGHYWAFCKVTGTMREHHFCCDDNCELENAD